MNLQQRKKKDLIDLTVLSKQVFFLHRRICCVPFNSPPYLGTNKNWVVRYTFFLKASLLYNNSTSSLSLQHHSWQEVETFSHAFWEVMIKPKATPSKPACKNNLIKYVWLFQLANRHMSLLPASQLWHVFSLHSSFCTVILLCQIKFNRDIPDIYGIPDLSF